MTATQTSKTSTAPDHSFLARLRVPGVLFATVALTLMLPGVLSVGAPAAEVAPIAPLVEAEPMAVDAALLAPTAPAEAQAAADPMDTLSFRTGDRLTPEQIDEFRAHVAALKAQGQHRGISQW